MLFCKQTEVSASFSAHCVTRSSSPTWQVDQQTKKKGCWLVLPYTCTWGSVEFPKVKVFTCRHAKNLEEDLSLASTQNFRFRSFFSKSFFCFQMFRRLLRLYEKFEELHKISLTKISWDLASLPIKQTKRGNTRRNKHFFVFIAGIFGNFPRLGIR